MMENKRRNAEHIRNLILLALSDGHFDNTEMRLIVKIASRLGLSCTEFENMLTNNLGNFRIPQSLPEKIVQLHDLVSVMMVDGVVHKKEEKLLQQFISFYGLSLDQDNDFSRFPMGNQLIQEPSYQEFIKTYKLMTAEQISEVCVDNDYKIKFPLYKSELRVNTLAKTLYIFFLKNPEGCEVKGLYKHKEQLCSIYSVMPGSHHDVCTRISNLINFTGECFNQNKTRINKSVKECIPKNETQLEQHYIIQRDKTQRMYVNLNQELIVIHPTI